MTAPMSKRLLTAQYPARGGTAPARLPVNVAYTECRFKHILYRPTYIVKPAKTMATDNPLIAAQRIAVPETQSNVP